MKGYFLKNKHLCFAFIETDADHKGSNVLALGAVCDLGRGNKL